MPKKPKVKLSKNKVALFCAIISGLCVFSLVLTIVLSSKNAPVAKETVNVEESAKSETLVITPPAQKKEPKKESLSQPKIIAKEETEKSEKKVSEKVPPKKASETKKNAVKSSGRQNQPERKSEPQKIQKKPDSQVASVIPPRQNDTVQENIPKNRFDIPPASNGATIVIVIDDAGGSVENTKRYASLPFPITIAVLPKLPKSRACADAVRAMGKEVILHQPMQSVNHNMNPGPGKITSEMSTYEIAEIVKENLLELGPGVKGMNNHEGSDVTANVIKIGAVLEVCAEKGIYFLDSRTTSATQVKQAALERDMESNVIEKAGPYLDNDIDRAKMLERMRETLAYANRHGRAVVIGHVDKSVKILPDLLAEMYPEMKAAGYRFATPSQLR